ncbi:MAG: tetratricopeptide repeat protein [Chlamydiota bacterium]
MRVLIVWLCMLSIGIVANAKEYGSVETCEIHDRGMEHYCTGNYDLALEDFNQVLERFYDIEIEKHLIPSSLWGQALCYACLEEDREAIFALEKLDLFLNSYVCDECQGISIMPCVQYAQRNKPIPIPDCIDRVQGTAHQMRGLCSSIKNKDTLRIFHKFIDGLEASGIRCCTHGDFWTECVDPLIQRWFKWKGYGLPANPYDN